MQGEESGTTELISHKGSGVGSAALLHGQSRKCQWEESRIFKLQEPERYGSVSGWVLARVSIAVVEHHEHKQLGEESIYFICISTSQFLIEGR